MNNTITRTVRAAARVLPIIGSLAFAPGVLAGTPACLVTHHDDYEDGVLDPGFTQLGSCGTVSEAGGVLTLAPCVTGAASVVFRQAAGVSVLCGNFDLSVDYALSAFTVPGTAHRWAGLKIHRASDGVIFCGVERLVAASPSCALANSVYKAFGTSTAPCDSSHVATTDTAGRFRITRSGVTFTLQYRDGGVWQTLHTVDQTTEDVVLSFSTGTGAGPTTHSISFDELTIDKQACCLPDGTCAVLAPAACATQGGVAMGGGTVCDDVACPQACCLDIKCLMLTPTDCVNLGGVPAGDGVSCLDGPCDPGACCMDTTCLQLNEPECLAGGGTFAGVGVECDDDPCNLLDCSPETDFGQSFDPGAFSLTPADAWVLVQPSSDPFAVNHVRCWMVFLTSDGLPCPAPAAPQFETAHLADDGGSPTLGGFLSESDVTLTGTGTLDPGSGAEVFRADLDVALTVSPNNGPFILTETARQVTLDGGWLGLRESTFGPCGTGRFIIDPGAAGSHFVSASLIDFTEVAGAAAICVEGSEVSACCMDTGECRLLTEFDCLAEGGAYAGERVSCFEDGLEISPFMGGLEVHPGLLIPDTDFVESTATITESATIGRLVVRLDIQHEFGGDLVVTLEHDGTTVTLIDRPGVPISPLGCFFGTYFGIVLTDNGTGGRIEDACEFGLTSPPFYVPNQLLHPFIGTDAAGDWTLRIEDVEAQDEGFLDGWSINYETGAPRCSPAGVCCLDAEDCIILTRDACLAQGGFFKANATACNEDGTCPVIPAADVDGNGFIGVDDLIAIIIAWGPCPQGLLCPEDVDVSDEVGVDDLVEVILAWTP